MASFYIFTIDRKHKYAFTHDTKYEYKIFKKINNFITGYLYIKDIDFDEEWYDTHNLCKIIFDNKNVLFMIDTFKQSKNFYNIGKIPFII